MGINIKYPKDNKYKYLMMSVTYICVTFIYSFIHYLHCLLMGLGRGTPWAQRRANIYTHMHTYCMDNLVKPGNLICMSLDYVRKLKDTCCFADSYQKVVKKNQTRTIVFRQLQKIQNVV